MTTWAEVARWAQKRSFDLVREHPEWTQGECQKAAYAEAKTRFPDYEPVSSNSGRRAAMIQIAKRRAEQTQPALTAEDAVIAAESLLVGVNKREGYHSLVVMVAEKKLPFVPSDKILLSIMQAFGVYPGKSQDKNFYNERKRMEREEGYSFVERADGFGFDVFDPVETESQKLRLEIAKMQTRLAELGKK